ncbi:UDP-N-acetylmuramate--alanine ligase [Cognatiyoonia sp. IB215182]|uniref:UDP-N-acetylmuramate--alanine ligase n=1 Tax=Cognatiyoonia sp. IB215182 TaxID=3097353 RepID=UPI002A0C363E|nr:UDP-N-acetylmuramate--alanine ligase [Cognatiyoonia sp. IB215182]MDX8351311.1 UDP-N-acetylmuramate--alanine ligase [Cognatiyoonia sp. IB215182]
MTQGMVLGGMLLFAGLPFALLTYLMRSGQSGLALTIVSIIGATLAMFIYASGRPFGIDPVLAMMIAMLACIPALLGSTAGAFLGWLLRRQDDRSVK